MHMYGALQLFKPDQDLVALLNAQGNLVVYDISRQRTLIAVEKAPQFFNFESVAMTLDGKHLVQFNRDGQFFVFNVDGDGQVLAGRYLDDEVVIYDETFRFDSTTEGASHVHLKFPGDRFLYQLDQFAATLRASGLTSSTFRGEDHSLTLPVLTTPPALNRSRLVEARVRTLEIRGTCGPVFGRMSFWRCRDGDQ
jgi:hypothetical protein